MAGAGSGGSGYFVGYRYSCLSCAPVLSLQLVKCTTSLYAGLEAADLRTSIAHLLIPLCSFACCISNSGVCVFRLPYSALANTGGGGGGGGAGGAGGGWGGVGGSGVVVVKCYNC